MKMDDNRTNKGILLPWRNLRYASVKADDQDSHRVPLVSSCTVSYYEVFVSIGSDASPITVHWPSLLSCTCSQVGELDSKGVLKYG